MKKALKAILAVICGVSFVAMFGEADTFLTQIVWTLSSAMIFVGSIYAMEALNRSEKKGRA